MSSYSQTVLHGEATVPDRYSRVQKGQWLSPQHHLHPTQRPQVVLVTHLRSHIYVYSVQRRVQYYYYYKLYSDIV